MSFFYKKDLPANHSIEQLIEKLGKIDSLIIERNELNFENIKLKEIMNK